MDIGNINIYTKPIMVECVSIGEEKFFLSNLYCCLMEIKETKENDNSCYSEYSLRDYELSYPNDMDKLVRLGLVLNYTGSRMANCYCMANEKAIIELEEKLNNLYEKFEYKATKNDKEP